MRISDWSSDVCSSDLVHRLAGDAAALLLILDEVQRAHIVQPVGQLHQQHPDVVRHGEQELAQIFRRPLIFGHGLDLAELRSEEHTSELQSLMRISYAVFSLKKKIKYKHS